MRFFDRASFVQGRDLADYVIAAIQALLVETRHAPRMLTVGLHTHIIGRPARIGGLDMVLDYLAGCGEQNWVARREDIAKHWLRETGITPS